LSPVSFDHTSSEAANEIFALSTFLMSRVLNPSQGYVFFDKSSPIVFKKIELNFAVAKSLKFSNTFETLNPLLLQEYFTNLVSKPPNLIASQSQ